MLFIKVLLIKKRVSCKQPYVIDYVVAIQTITKDVNVLAITHGDCLR